MYLVFLFYSRAPDKVQTVRCEQESCAGLFIGHLFTNLLYVSNWIGVERVGEIADLIVRIICVRLCIRLIGGQESIATQTLRRALDAQTGNRDKRRSLYSVQVQHRISLAVPEANEFCVVFQGRDKVELAGSVNLRRAFLFDMGWVGHVED